MNGARRKTTISNTNRNFSQQHGQQICHFYQRGICRFGSRCRYLHINETRFSQASNRRENPNNNTHVRKNTKAGGSTSRASAVANEKMCSICLEDILKKRNIRDRIFGILPNCNHCFCFKCIRTWRQNKEISPEVTKSCPECRKQSDFVYSSRTWFDSNEEKQSFIFQKKTFLQKVDCKYFRKGRGRCPFGNKCFYLHALPDGTKRDVGPPKPRTSGESQNWTMLEGLDDIYLSMQELDLYDDWEDLMFPSDDSDDCPTDYFDDPFDDISDEFYEYLFTID
ncbi:hypothetical protein ABEB36_012299 [Hypothenemus hampei]|uniref:RING-type E3 ubiquitin transferase n=1 Tax=Hypothenemus hampei TaxID=57062 RepID=A0ABD1EDF1_HYPHA